MTDPAWMLGGSAFELAGIGTGLFYDSKTLASVGNFAAGAAVGNAGGPVSPAATPAQIVPPSALGAFAAG